KNPYIEVELTEDESAGRFGRYDFQKAIVWSPLKEPLQGASIQLDGVFAEKFAEFRQNLTHSLIKAVHIGKNNNSVQLPDLLNTVNGRQFEHCLLIVQAN